MIVRYNSQLAHSVAFKFIMNGFSELLNAGHTVDKLIFDNKSQVVFVVDDYNVIMGASVFCVTAEKEGLIQFSYVDPKFRKQGVYKLMYSNIETRCKTQNAVILLSFVWSNNIAMLNAAQTLGRVITSVRVAKSLVD